MPGCSGFTLGDSQTLPCVSITPSCQKNKGRKKQGKKSSWFEMRSCLIKGKEKIETKAVKKQKEKTVILYFSSASNVQPQHGSKASVFVVVALEDPHFHIKSVCKSHSLSSSPCWAWYNTVWNILLVKLGQLSWQCLFPTPSLPAFWGCVVGVVSIYAIPALLSNSQDTAVV